MTDKARKVYEIAEQHELAALLESLADIPHLFRAVYGRPQGGAAGRLKRKESGAIIWA